MILYFDTETTLISDDEPIPTFVCASYAINNEPIQLTKDPNEIADLIETASVIVGHNVAFDMSVIGRAVSYSLVFQAYREHRVTCTMLRQKLIDIAYDLYMPKAKGRYSLAGMASRLLNEHVEKNDTWRLKYGTLLSVPLEEWPEDATSYAINDTDITRRIYGNQQTRAGLLHDEYSQAQAAFWLRLVEVEGMFTDENRVVEIERETLDSMRALETRLVSCGLLTPDGNRIMSAIRDRVKSAASVAGTTPPMTDNGAVKTSKEAIEPLSQYDTTLSQYTEYCALQKLNGTYIQMLHKGTAEYPIRPRINSLLETGRVSMSDPSLQVMPRKEGVRECFVPAPGHAYLIADYGKLELCSFAQVCLALFGESRMAARLNAGFDPHLDVACNYLGMSYDDAKKQKDTRRVKDARGAAKAANFGFLGGSSAATWQLYARNGYGVHVSLDDAIEIKRVWTDTWPEAPLYHQYIAKHAKQQPFALESIKSKRTRGGLTFTSGANYLFQALGADAAKAAGFLVSKACYVDQNSPLFGCKIVNFIHDEFILEVPDDNLIHERGEELSRLMRLGASEYLPDVIPDAEPLACAYWSKRAKPVFDSRGRLQVWRGSDD